MSSSSFVALDAPSKWAVSGLGELDCNAGLDGKARRGDLALARRKWLQWRVVMYMSHSQVRE